MDDPGPPPTLQQNAGVIYISFDDDELEQSGAREERRSSPPRRFQQLLKQSKKPHRMAGELRRLHTDHQSNDEQREEDALPFWVDWTSLPDEIVWQIFSYLDVWTLIQVGQSSKTWRRISQDQYIGTTLDFSKFKARLLDENFTLILERLHAPRLKSINLHGCSSVTAKAIARIPEQCPNLTDLLLSGCLAVNNFALYCLFTKEGSTGEKAPPSEQMNSRARRRWYLAQLNQWNRGDWRPMASLAVLRLSYCSHVSDKAIAWVLQCCPNLEELYLSGCARITDQTCQLLAAKQVLAQPAALALMTMTSSSSDSADEVVAESARRGLRLLDLTGCFRITAQGLVSLLSSLTSLGTLYAPPCLGQWDAFTDARLWLDAALAFPHLRALHLSGMSVKGDTITETLPKRFANLVALDLSGSKLLSAHAVRDRDDGAGDDDGDDGLDWSEGGLHGDNNDDGDEADRRVRGRMEDAWAGMLATMPQLRDINLRACAGVRHDVLASLQATFPHVRLSY